MADNSDAYLNRMPSSDERENRIDELERELSQAKADLARLTGRASKNPCVLQNTHCLTHDRGYAFCFSDAIDRAEKSEALAKEQERRIADLEDAGEILKGYAESYALQTYDRHGTVRKAVDAWQKALTPEPAKEDGNNG